MSLVYIIEDDLTMSDCLGLIVRATPLTAPDGTISSPHAMIFHDAISAMRELDQFPPDVILLDILLTGPNGFTFLNELISYRDTARIPVILISSLDLGDRDLSHYGVVQILDKSTMTPETIQAAIISALADRSDQTSTVAISEQTIEDVSLPPISSDASSGLALLNQKLATSESAASSAATPDGVEHAE